jgi:thioredoxin reductase (NADPH)
MDEGKLDCLIIGAGPAGLTAAIYLARFHLSLRVVDAGRSRASWIACTRNVPGFPDGVSGNALLRLMREQAEKHGAAFSAGRVTRLDRIDGGFAAEWGEGSATARTVLLATGVASRRPDMDEALHEEALARGLIRYCPICDGYEVTDKKIGVIGSGSHGVAEAVFLRGYSADITLIAPGKAHRLSPVDQDRLKTYGIGTVDGPSRGVAVQEDCIIVETAAGHHAFDSVYPALGTDTHVELAEQVGAEIGADSRCIPVDAHQRTNVAHLYAAGDVVLGLDQISHAMGQGGVAATSIRNDLAEIRPLMR